MNSAPEAEKIFKDWGKSNQFRISLAHFVSSFEFAR